MWVFSYLHNAVFSDFFPEEVVPYLATDSLCPQKAVSPGLSCVAIFNWNSLHLTWGKKPWCGELYPCPCFSESTCVPPNNVSVPLLMPLVTLMEREAVTFEGTDMWEKNDESCEIMLNHLATARLMAEAADSYRMNAERILAGKSWFWLSCSLLCTVIGMKKWKEHQCSQFEKDQVGKIKTWEFHFLYYLLLIPTWLKDLSSLLLCQWYKECQFVYH